MRLMYQHPDPGAGLIVVKASGLPVFITVDEAFTHRSVHVIADRGLAASAHLTGPSGKTFSIKVGRPSVFDTVRDTLGLGGGASAARGGIVSGGSIDNNTLGAGGEAQVDPGEPGVHLSVPLRCTFDLKGYSNIILIAGGVEMSFELALSCHCLEMIR